MFLWFFITLAGSSFIGIIVTFFVSCENQNVEIEKNNVAERYLPSEQTFNSDSERKTFQMRMTGNKALETQVVGEVETKQL